MTGERFNRQFVLIDFEDLDNPEFMAFVRSPEFSTYLILRRHVWRSAETPHSAGLHEYYAQGWLATSLSRRYIAEALGGVSLRTVTADITNLLKRRVIRRVVLEDNTAIYLLGRWRIIKEEEGEIYVEYYFLDALLGGMEENFHRGGRNLPEGMEENCDTLWKKSSTNNIEESNRESSNRESSKFSKQTSLLEEGRKRQVGDDEDVTSEVTGTSPNRKSSTFLKKTSDLIEVTIETISRELDDLEHLDANLTQAANLWGKNPHLSEEEFFRLIQRARRTTLERISLGVIRDRRKRMAYFFAVLRDLLESGSEGAVS